MSKIKEQEIKLAGGKVEANKTRWLLSLGMRELWNSCSWIGQVTGLREHSGTLRAKLLPVVPSVCGSRTTSGWESSPRICFPHVPHSLLLCFPSPWCFSCQILHPPQPRKGDCVIFAVGCQFTSSLVKEWQKVKQHPSFWCLLKD